MNSRSALSIIKRVKRSYVIYGLAVDALLAGIIAVGIFILLYFLIQNALLWAIVAYLLTLGVLIIVHKVWLVNDKAIAGFLDVHYPELEESCSLVIIQAANLNLLQKLQLIKVEPVLQRLPFNHLFFFKRLRLNSIFFFSMLIPAFFVSKLHFNKTVGRNLFTKESITVSNTPGRILPQLKSVQIQLSPPAYTRLPGSGQDQFALQVVEGTVVNWKLITNLPVHTTTLLFNERDTVQLKSKNKTDWTAQKAIFNPGFYQLIIDGKLSNLYQVQVVKDTPPVIQIKTPKQYTYIDAGEKQIINLNAEITDDYGVADAAIYATIAKGSGEAVKFKEQKISFSGSFSNEAHRYDLNKTIDLPALKMEPGDELYFYIQAQDNHHQLSRTDVYIVSIQDTAQLLSMDGILSGANIKPEYFRSERQIILDSETLLKEKDTLNQEIFKNRSNDLGIDQKILRLRYGKFLGEEAEGNIADPRLEGNDKTADPKDFGNGAKILDEYTDKHDNAEDAQFFDPTVKAQLKATLTEMWKAELQLRLYKPQDALPYAYKALRLLKDLQQKSRSYVAKTAYNPSPLKMDKRLSGDLTKIIQPDDHKEIKMAADQFDALKRSATILEQFKTTAGLKSSDYKTLQTAGQRLSIKAAAQPALYLASVSAMRRLLAGNKDSYSKDAAIIETAIRRILPVSQVLPKSELSTPDMGLSDGYFRDIYRLDH